MAYDVQSNFLPMIHAQPRTPGPGMMRPDLPSREESFVSVLSDEASSFRPSAAVTPLEGPGTGTGSGSLESGNGSIRSENVDGIGSGNGIVRIDGDGLGDDDAEELKCRKCGSEKFVMIRGGGSGGRTNGLKCRTCGSEVT